MSTLEIGLLLIIAALLGAVGAYFGAAVPARAKAGVAERRSIELETELRAERAAHTARVEELEKMGTEIERKFVVLASEALSKNSQGFLALASERFNIHKIEAEKDLAERQKAIEIVVKPLNDSLSKLEQEVTELEKSREGAYGAITEQVKHLSEGQAQLRTETGRLVQALRRPQTRGRWGEYQLRNVLEMAGMTEHVDFVQQHTVESGSNLLRPDVIVRIPGGKSMVVDAKTPLEGYLAAIEAADEDTRQQQLANHARQVRNHIRELGSRDYWKALPVTPDFVIMFVPAEAFFAAAIESDPNIFEQAVRQRVLISTPMTLVALIKAISYGWQQEKLAENAQQVASLARELYDRIKIFGDHMGRLGRSLRQAIERYNDGVGSLEQRVLPVARRFENLGVISPGSAISELAPVEIQPRELVSPELTAPQAATAMS
jgi:DNA recombination protein RmuC